MNRRTVWFCIVVLVVAVLGKLDTTDVPLYTTERRTAPDSQETIVIRRHNFTGEVQVFRSPPIPWTAGRVP